MSNNETLREAAALLRERAQEAACRCGGSACTPEFSGVRVGEMKQRFDDTPSVIEHYANWTPAVALAVADLLDAAHASYSEASTILAHPWHDESCECLSHKEYRAHLTLARAYLGEVA